MLQTGNVNRIQDIFLPGEYVRGYVQALLQELSDFNFRTTQNELNSQEVLCM
jgi:hypothetical protein